MADESRFAPLLDWLRALARNAYFWYGMAALVAVAAVLYVGFNSFIMPAYTRHDVSTMVPDVENRPFEEAQETIQQRGLQVERQVGRYNPNVPQGQVVDQSPPPNTAVKPGRRVYLTVNSGRAPMVKLPNLSGTSLREAKNRLMALGLEIGQVRADSIPSPYPNTVTRQEPAPGDSLRQGEQVELWYSEGLGETYVEVPDLRGLRVEAARAQLLRQKLRSVVVGADTTDAEDEEEPEKLFVRQQGRAPGARVRTGTEIRLFTTQDSTEIERTPPDSTGTDSESTDEGEDGLPF